MKNNRIEFEKKIQKGLKVYTMFLMILGIFMLSTPVLAADDPITVVNNLSDFIFQITKVIGGIIVGYSIVQIGLSFTSHDSSQRVNGFLFFLGGVIIMFSKEILNMISG